MDIRRFTESVIRDGASQKCVEGWATIQFKDNDRTFRLRLCFMDDGSVTWDIPPDFWPEAWEHRHPRDDRELDD